MQKWFLRELANYLSLKTAPCFLPHKRLCFCVFGAESGRLKKCGFQPLHENIPPGRRFPDSFSPPAVNDRPGKMPCPARPEGPPLQIIRTEAVEIFGERPCPPSSFLPAADVPGDVPAHVSAHSLPELRMTGETVSVQVTQTGVFFTAGLILFGPAFSGIFQ